jgi:hypothetical protein
MYSTTVSPMPERIQLRRTKGWRIPPNTVVVSRPSRWGNPYQVGTDGVPDRETAVRLFRALLRRQFNELSNRYFVFVDERLRADLRGKNLACWCQIGSPCHADVLLEIANGPAVIGSSEPAK